MADVGMDAVGNFAVLYRKWKPRTPANAEPATLTVKRYTVAGAAIGKAISVADTVAYNHFKQSMAMDATGRFVVVWEDGRNAFAQRFSSSGQKVGSQITVVNSLSQVWQSTVCMNDAGRFVVAWSAFGPDFMLKAQVFDWGTPIGSNIILAANTLANQSIGWENVGCDIDAANNVTFAWSSRFGIGLPTEVAFRRLTGAGVLEPTLLVNSTTQGEQIYPGVAALGNDKFVVVWQGYGPGDDQGIFAQRFGLPAAPRPGLVAFDYFDVPADREPWE
jgi:hypothetical protein